MGTAGMSVADAQAIAHLFDVLPFVVIGALACLAVLFFKGARNRPDVYDEFDENRLKNPNDQSRFL